MICFVVFGEIFNQSSLRLANLHEDEEEKNEETKNGKKKKKQVSVFHGCYFKAIYRRALVPTQCLNRLNFFSSNSYQIAFYFRAQGSRRHGGNRRSPRRLAQARNKWFASVVLNLLSLSIFLFAYLQKPARMLSSRWIVDQESKH